MGLLESHQMTQHGKTREKRWTWKQSTDIPDRVPQGGGKGVSSGGVSREVRDTDGNASPLLEEARAGHSHYLGGGKSPSSEMHKM